MQLYLLVDNYYNAERDFFIPIVIVIFYVITVFDIGARDERFLRAVFNIYVSSFVRKFEMSTVHDGFYTIRTRIVYNVVVIITTIF